jgi:two-component system LytT family response regulator
MNLRAVIIDDEIDGIKSLKLLIEKFVSGVNVIAESTDPAQGLTCIENYRPDVVFLDISMPGMSGIELIERLSFRGFQLVYTTAHKEYALKALKLGTTDYLLKPIDADDLIAAVKRVREKLQKNDPTALSEEKLKQALAQASQKSKILISDKEITEYCDPDDIIRLEANSNYTWVVFKNKKTMLVSKTLKDFEKQLDFPGSPFMRVHQSHIVNINHCVRYKKEEGGLLEMTDESRLPISPNRKDEFLKRINYSG